MRRVARVKTIDYLVRSTWLNITKMYNERAAKHDTTMVMGFTLLSINPKSGTPSTQLGPKMGLEPTSISRTLKVLEEKRLIIRKPHPKDGRSVIIELTEEGLRARDLSKRNVMTFYNKVEDEFDKEELRSFVRFMGRLNKLIDENKIYN